MADRLDGVAIVGGNKAGFVGAVDAVCDNPNPWHIEEDRAALGIIRRTRDIIDEALSRTAVASYATREAAAIICGITHGGEDVPHAVWMLATANSVNHPRWMIRTMRNRLALGREFLGGNPVLMQLIPVSYSEGINFARHMGFEPASYVSLPATGKVFAVVAGPAAARKGI